MSIEKLRNTSLLFVSLLSPTSNTGVEKTMRNILPEIAKYYKTTVTFYATEELNNNQLHWFKENRINFKVFRLPKVFGFEFYLYIIISNIWVFLNRGKFDVVTGNNISAFFYLYLCKFARCRTTTVTIFQNVKASYYWSGGESLALWQKIMAWVDRYTAQNSDHIIAVSNGVKKQLQQFYGISEQRVTTIYNSVVYNTNNIASRYPGQESSKREILFISNDNKRKGLDTFIGIVNLYKNSDGVTFTIIGSDKTGLIDMPNLRHTGPIANEEVLAIIKGAYLLVLPSHNEGHPFVALEALSCGVPVVCSSLSNVEIIENTPAGVVINGFDPLDYKTAIDTYLHSEEYYLEGRTAAERLIRDTYSLENTVKRYVNYYKRLVER